MSKASKEKILNGLIENLNETSETLYKKHKCFSAGVLGLPGTLMIYSGVLDAQNAAGLMLMTVKGLAESLNLVTDDEAGFLEELADRFKNYSPE